MRHSIYIEGVVAFQKFPANRRKIGKQNVCMYFICINMSTNLIFWNDYVNCRNSCNFKVETTLNIADSKS